LAQVWLGSSVAPKNAALGGFGQRQKQLSFGADNIQSLLCLPNALPQVMSAKQSMQQDRRARAKLRRGLKAKVTALEAETTDTGSTASDESGHEVPQMDLLWPSQPLPPGELRRVQDCPERCSLSPGQVFRTSQGHLPVGRVDEPVVAPEVQDTKVPTNRQKKSPGFLGCKALPTPGVGTAPLKVQLPRELMLFAEVCRDPCMPAKKQLSDFLLAPTRSVLSDSEHV